MLTVMWVSLEAGRSPLEPELNAAPADTLNAVLHETSRRQTQLSHAWILDLHKLWDHKFLKSLNMKAICYVAVDN